MKVGGPGGCVVGRMVVRVADGVGLLAGEGFLRRGFAIGEGASGGGDYFKSATVIDRRYTDETVGPADGSSCGGQ